MRCSHLPETALKHKLGSNATSRAEHVAPGAPRRAPPSVRARAAVQNFVVNISMALVVRSQPVAGLASWGGGAARARAPSERGRSRSSPTSVPSQSSFCRPSHLSPQIGMDFVDSGRIYTNSPHCQHFSGDIGLTRARGQVGVHRCTLAPAPERLRPCSRFQHTRQPPCRCATLRAARAASTDTEAAHGRRATSRCPIQTLVVPSPSGMQRVEESNRLSPAIILTVKGNM